MTALPSAPMNTTCSSAERGRSTAVRHLAACMDNDANAADSRRPLPDRCTAAEVGTSSECVGRIRGSELPLRTVWLDFFGIDSPPSTHPLIPFALYVERENDRFKKPHRAAPDEPFFSYPTRK